MNKLLLSFLLVFALGTGNCLLAAKDYYQKNSAQTSTEVEHLTDQNFFPKTAQGLVIVDFFADWCGPCKQFAPIYSKVANEMKGQLAFYKLNVDEAPNSMKKIRIFSIPTVIIYKNGKEVKRQSGYFDEASLRNMIQSVSNK